MSIRAGYITFDCFGTLTRFRMSEVAREMFGDRVNAERVEQFVEITDIGGLPGVVGL